MTKKLYLNQKMYQKIIQERVKNLKIKSIGLDHDRLPKWVNPIGAENFVIPALYIELAKMNYKMNFREKCFKR